MLMVISPAKRLDFESPLLPVAGSEPDFLERASVLVKRLQALSPAELAGLMGISDNLAWCNFQRFAEWRLPCDPELARPALLAFDGDVYDGINAREMAVEDLDFSRHCLRILSGLYGVLRPLDLILPHRLEMGTRLENPAGRDLYVFWGETVTAAIQAELQTMEQPVLVNLASQEYFKVLLPGRLHARVVTPVFEDWKGGRFRVISLYAKRARGLMAGFAIRRRVCDVDALRDFGEEGYAFVPAASDEDRWVFRR